MIKKCCCVVLNFNDYNTTLSFIDYVYDFKSIDYILVVDNCSTDESYDILKEKEDIKIKVLRCDNNGGYGAGNNFGVYYAFKRLNCSHVIFSNPDVVFEDSTVIEMNDALNSNSAIAAVSAIQYDITGRKINHMAWRIPSAFKYAFTFSELGTMFAGILYPLEYFHNDIVEVDCVPGAMLMVDADKFIKIGGYDERMFLYCEEDVIGYKIIMNGFKTCLLTKEKYVHMHGVSINKTFSSKIAQLDMEYKNKLFFMKNYLKANVFEMFIARINICIKLCILKLKKE